MHHTYTSCIRAETASRVDTAVCAAPVKYTGLIFPRRSFFRFLDGGIDFSGLHVYFVWRKKVFPVVRAVSRLTVSRLTISRRQVTSWLGVATSYVR